MVLSKTASSSYSATYTPLLRPSPLSNRLRSCRSTSAPWIQDGARRLGHQYAADILAQFGGKSLIGSRIIFVSDRTGNKEIWSMSYDGTDQHQITHYSTTQLLPSVSADGKKLAFTTWLHGQPEIVLLSLETNRRLPFYNQHASMNALSISSRMPAIAFSSTVSGGPANSIRRMSTAATCTGSRVQCHCGRAQDQPQDRR